MQNVKYEFTGETKNHNGVTLKRIRCVTAFLGVNVGNLGGWIESEANLSQFGAAWVYDNARVYANAQVYGDARVYDKAWVYDDAQVFGDARVYGKAWVYDKAWVAGNARVYANAWVYGEARVFDNVRVGGEAWVYANARVFDDAWVYDNAQVYGDAQVYANARVSGEAWVAGHAQVSDDADLLLIGPIGSRRAFLTVHSDSKIGVRFNTGCFSGSRHELIAAIESTHAVGTLYRKQYDAALEMAKIVRNAATHGEAHIARFVMQ